MRHYMAFLSIQVCGLNTPMGLEEILNKIIIWDVSRCFKSLRLLMYDWSGEGIVFQLLGISGGTEPQRVESLSSFGNQGLLSANDRGNSSEQSGLDGCAFHFFIQRVVLSEGKTPTITLNNKRHYLHRLVPTQWSVRLNGAY